MDNEFSYGPVSRWPQEAVQEHCTSSNFLEPFCPREKSVSLSEAYRV
jgi:hypothetical protein